jgi:hypothetical protein
MIVVPVASRVESRGKTHAHRIFTAGGNFVVPIARVVDVAKVFKQLPKQLSVIGWWQNWDDFKIRIDRRRINWQVETWDLDERSWRNVCVIFRNFRKIGPGAIFPIDSFKFLCVRLLAK